MCKKLEFIGAALLIVCGLAVRPAGAADESITGKWNAVAETPEGPRALEFEFKQDGAKIGGTATLGQASGSFSAVKFEPPKFAGDLEIRGGTFRLLGSLKDGKLEGTWEQVGSEIKGTWTAVRALPSGPSTTASSAAGISGTWETLAVTPNGDLTAALEIRQEAEKVSGEIKSDMGSLPIQAVSFKDDKLQFDLDLGGTVYRIQATLKEGKFVGGWAPAAGGDGGAWSATRKASAPAPAAAPKPEVPAIVGTWNAVAFTPDGEMRFAVEIKQDGGALNGSVSTPDGTIPLQKVSYTDDKLTFELDFMGGTYRIEAALAVDKLTGKWSAVGGSDAGNLTAERKK